MPIYEYMCKECGKAFSTLVMGPSQGGPCCPSCGSGDLRKLLSPFSPMPGSSSGGGGASYSPGGGGGG